MKEVISKSPARFSIAFGAIVAPIKEQLQSQKIKLTAAFVKKQQGDADAINRLLISGLIPDSVVAKSRKLILTRIQKEILKK